MVQDAGAPTLTAIVPATDGPATVERVAAAIAAAAQPPDEVIVVREPATAGPAAARNAGAHRARGDVLVFVDADVVVHADAFARIRERFASEPGLVAVFGSYDSEPEAEGAVSEFRNLLHHHVHQGAPGPATTFWAGLGAVRRDWFLSAGGFDERRYPNASIEDVDLGMRLSDAGARIELDPLLLGTHLKRWTLASMVRTDLVLRGAPWVALLLRRRHTSAVLNLGWRHRLSALAALAAAAELVARRPLRVLAALATLPVLNLSFYALLVRRGGAREAAAGMGLHVLHHLTSVAAVPLGLAEWLRDGDRAQDGSSVQPEK